MKLVARLLATCSLTAALLFPAWATAQSCTAGQQCASGLCANSVCAPTLDNGKACSAFQQCSSKNCFQHVCSPTKPDGATCSVNNECSANNCFSGRCGASKPNGAVCAFAQECSSQNCMSNVCSGLRPLGERCVTSNECGSKNCVQFVCLAQSPAAPSEDRSTPSLSRSVPRPTAAQAPPTSSAAGQPPSGVPACRGSACDQLTLSRPDGCFTIVSKAPADVRFFVDPLSGGLISGGERFVLRSVELQDSDACDKRAATEIVADYADGKEHKPAPCPGPGTCRGTATIMRDLRDRSVAINSLGAGNGYDWSPPSRVCTYPLAEGWTITSHTIRLEGDRKACGAHARCEKLLETPRRVCYTLSVQGHTESNSGFGTTKIFIDYKTVYERPKDLDK